MNTLRWGVLGLASAATIGAAAELVAERHWQTPVQLIPWYALGALTVAIGLIAIRRGVGLAQLIALLVLFTSLFGIYEHIHANLDAGILDGRYTNVWNTLPAWKQWWYAVSKTVGPTPPLAPGVLAQASLLALLGSRGLRQEARERRARQEA